MGKTTIAELKKHFLTNVNEAFLLRCVVEFIDSRSDFLNDNKSINTLTSEFLRHFEQTGECGIRDINHLNQPCTLHTRN